MPDAWAMTGAHLVLARAAYRLAGRTLSEAEVAAIALAVAMGALVAGRAWRVGRLAVTAVHEGGHTAAAVLTGRKVAAVHLRADASGATFETMLARTGLSRDEVFVTNAVLCNPRDGAGRNRPPRPGELLRCRRHLAATLEAVRRGYRVVFSSAILFLFLGTVLVSRIKAVR